MFQFAPDTRISVDYNQRLKEWTLIIQDVKPSDEGYYCCQISTKHDRDTYDIRLNVRSTFDHGRVAAGRRGAVVG